MCSHLSLCFVLTPLVGCRLRIPPVCCSWSPACLPCEGAFCALCAGPLVCPPLVFTVVQPTDCRRASRSGRNTLSAHAELILPLNSLLTVLTASYHPAHRRRQTNAGLKLVQRRRRWSDNKPTLVQPCANYQKFWFEKVKTLLQKDYFLYSFIVFNDISLVELL